MQIQIECQQDLYNQLSLILFEVLMQYAILFKFINIMHRKPPAGNTRSASRAKEKKETTQKSNQNETVSSKHAPPQPIQSGTNAKYEEDKHSPVQVKDFFGAQDEASPYESPAAHIPANFGDAHEVSGDSGFSRDRGRGRNLGRGRGRTHQEAFARDDEVNKAAGAQPRRRGQPDAARKQDLTINTSSQNSQGSGQVLPLLLSQETDFREWAPARDYSTHWGFKAGDPCTQFASTFDVEQQLEKQQFIVGTPHLLASLDLKAFYSNAQTMKTMDASQKRLFLADLKAHIDSHDALKTSGVIARIIHRLSDYVLRPQFVWLINSMFRTTYQNLGSFLPAAVQASSGRGQTHLKDPAFAEMFGTISQIELTAQDFSREACSKFPGICMDAPQKLTEFLRKDSIMGMRMFGTGGIFDAEASPSSILEIIKEFQRVVRGAVSSDLKSITDLINNNHLMAISIFRWFYQNSDLSPKPLNFFKDKTTPFPKEICALTIYHRLFNGLSQLCGGPLTNKDVIQFAADEASSIWKQLNAKECWQQNKLSNSITYKSIVSEANKDKDKGIRIWGENQLPLEASKHCKLLRFDINVITMYCLYKINDISKLTMEREAPIARAAAAALAQAKRVPQQKITQKGSAFDEKKAWFLTLLNKTYPVPYEQAQYDEFIRAVAGSPELDGFYMNLALSMLQSVEQGPGMFYAYMAKLVRELQLSGDIAESVKSLEEEVDLKCRDTIGALFTEASQAFSYIPTVFFRPIIDWITHSKSPGIDPKLVRSFITSIRETGGSQLPVLPLSWIPKAGPDRSSTQYIIQSNKIDASLLEVCTQNYARIERTQLTFAFTLLPGCASFAEWLVKSNDSTIEAFKKSLEENPAAFKSFAAFIDDRRQREGKGFSLTIEFLLQMLQAHGGSSIELIQFRDMNSDDWEKAFQRLTTGEEYECFLPNVQNVARRVLRYHDSPAKYEEVMEDYEREYTDAKCSRCLPDIPDQILSRDWQRLVAALNVHLVRDETAVNKWIMNSIATGCGKSVVISFIAHNLALNDIPVVVLSCNPFLQSQLDTNFFNDTHDKRALIRHFSAATNEFLGYLIPHHHGPDGEIEKTVVLVDEFDSYGGAGRLLVHHAHFVAADGTHTTRVYTVDILRALSHFKNIIGFSSKTPISISNALTRMNPTDAIIRCDFGNLKGTGKASYLDPVWLPRSGPLPEHFMADTIGQIVAVLEGKDGPAPRCIYAIHNYEDQIPAIRDSLKKLHQDRLQNREVLILTDLDSYTDAKKYTRTSKALIKSPNGFVFITHCAASRGVDIKGVEPSTVIANYRFPSGADLDQSLGRGNRSMDKTAKPSKTYVFYDLKKDEKAAERVHPTIDQMIDEHSVVLNLQQVEIDKLYKAFHCLAFDFHSTPEEGASRLPEYSKSFLLGLHSLVGADSDMQFRLLAETFFFALTGASFLQQEGGGEFLAGAGRRPKALRTDKARRDLDSQDDLKAFVESLLRPVLTHLTQFSEKFWGNIQTFLIVLYLLQRGVACGFNLFREEKKYQVDYFLTALLHQLKDETVCQHIRTFQLFTKGGMNGYLPPKELEDAFDSITNPASSLFM